MTPRLALVLSTCILACAGLRSRPAAPDAPGPLHVARMNGRWGYVDDGARVVLAPDWDEAWPFVDGRARVRRGEELLFIDDTGKVLGPATPPVPTPEELARHGPCPTGFGATPAGVDDVPCTEEEQQFAETPFAELFALRTSGRDLQQRWDGARGYGRDATERRADVLDIGARLESLDDAEFALPLPPPLRAMEAHFEVVEVLEPRTGAAVARIRGGTNEGLALGTTGTAWKHPAQDPAEAIGFARVIEVGPGTAVVLVKSLRDNLVPTAPEVAAGQTVALPMKVPERPFRGVVLDLLALGIVFTDGVDPLLTLPHAIRVQSPQLEMQVLEDARRAIAETAERERPGATNPAWLSPQESGRFAGKGLLDAMSSATVEDVRAFFEFVRAYPGKYIGRQWRIDETFATWVVNGTPGAQ